MPRVYNKHKDDVPRQAVYIGRGSPYGNPFVIGTHGTRDDVCDKYEKEVLPSLNVEPLRGKDLVCFCAPKRCHGDSILNKLYRGTRVLVCGGRNFRDRALLFATLDRLHAEWKFTEFIQGEAPGADRLARDWACTKREIKRWKCPAKWTDLSHPDAVIRTRRDGTKYDAKAGTRRNAKMLEWKPNLVVAFPGGSGTADMVRRARDAGVEVIEVKYAD